MSDITHVNIRMYTMGTGDCFALKFFSGDAIKLKIIIDAGVWSGSKAHLQPYVEDLLTYVNNKVDILVITHEHKDHVYTFDACGDLFLNAGFEADEVWMAWTENDSSKKVKEWKRKYGEQRKALAMAAEALQKAVATDEYQKQFDGNLRGMDTLESRKDFIKTINSFADLHVSADENNLYSGGLKGMEFVKHKIKKNKVRYFSPGDIITNLKGAQGLKIYVLGPPSLYENVAKETGGAGESYEHNKVLEQSGAFGASVLGMMDSSDYNELLPFDDSYVSSSQAYLQNEYDSYDWRKIDFDWLYSADSLALRLNSLTNNLSLALAFEFEKSGKIMLFPGDAEYGSWASWHNIKWSDKRPDGKLLLTENLLNRVVFYKVAHHSSHNGTAKRLGFDMMTSKHLSAMVTLDYNVIPPGWIKTMPNRELLKELLAKTKGRLMILNEEGLFYDFDEQEPVAEKVAEARKEMTEKEAAEFSKAFKKETYFIQYTVHS